MAADGTDRSRLFETKNDRNTNSISVHCNDKQLEPCSSTVSDTCFRKKRRRKHHFAGTFYSCTWCRKRFLYRSNLYQHMNIHTGKHKCTDCGECCRSNHDLVLHRRRHHSGQKLFENAACGKQLTVPSELLVQSRVRGVQKLYKCPICVKAFRQSGSLDIHMRVHTGDKLYCLRSNKCFSQVDNAQMIVHCEQSSRRSSRCPYCGKLFKTKHLLKQHVCVHTGAKPYSCRHCSDRFMWRQQLKQHLLKSHSEGIFCEICLNTFSHILQVF